ncbi:DUF465 domain-containing protein [Minwuia sp.]|uniref:DUF465 domain-containing protein n=1 Tax=Minwuia sp. TaxID=2493630 RepID=UPI003A919775
MTAADRLPRSGKPSREHNVTAKTSLNRLQQKHTELDEALQREEARPLPDDALISKLKKEKLRLKDAMAAREHEAA